MSQKKIAITVVAVLLAASILAVTGSKNGSQKGTAKGGPSPAASAQSDSGDVSAVRTQAVARTTLRPYVEEYGNVQAEVNISIVPDIGGILKNVDVVVGDSVSKGQTIARVDPSKPGSSYSMSPVVAPISGTITSVDAEQGQTVTTSTAIAEVGEIGNLEIVVYLPERDSAKVRKGMNGVVTFAALPGESLPLQVSKVSPVLDATSRTREIRLKLLNPDQRVAAGMYAEVKVYVDPLADRLVIPESAVIERNGEKFVFASLSQADGSLVAKKRAVTLGTVVDGTAEVLSGLQLNEKIVVEGQTLLGDGAKIVESTGSSR